MFNGAIMPLSPLIQEKFCKYRFTTRSLLEAERVIKIQVGLRKIGAEGFSDKAALEVLRQFLPKIRGNAYTD